MLKKVPARRLLSGEPARISAARADLCSAGEKWQWDGVDFQLLHPDETRHWSGNNASCVLLISNAAGRILLTGDIEGAAERSLSARFVLPKIDLLVVPHHGSKSSSSARFVTTTDPDYALISAGYLNRFRFPHPAVARRWSLQGAQLLDTAHSGAIHFRLQADGRIEGPFEFRRQRRRYWQHKPADRPSE